MSGMILWCCFKQSVTVRETCCAGRKASFSLFLYPRGCCCVAVLTEANENLLPFISQLVHPVLQTTHASPKHGSGLWIFGLLGRFVELQPHHVCLSMHSCGGSLSG